MNYLYFHMGNYPDHLIDSIKSVTVNDPDSKIFLCGDRCINLPNVKFIESSKIISRQTKLAIDSSLWKYDPNPLWRSSIYRLFYLMDMMEHFDLNDFVHFDSDVLLFHSFDKIKESINLNKTGLHITPCNDHELVFGYSYCNSYIKLCSICDLVLQSMYDSSFLQSLIKDHPNEMQILSGIKKITDFIIDLPTIPILNNEYVFDPSSYGQYLFGTHSGEPVGWHGDHHWIGRMIKDKKLNIRILNGFPYVNNSKIVNLHIHSKKTKGIINV